MLRKSILVVAAILFALVSNAQAVEREADHTALRNLRQKVTNAINSRDIDALRSCLANEFSFTTIDQTIITNEKELKAYYDKIFTGKDAIVEGMTIEATPDILTRFTSENTGYNYGSSVETYKLKNGKSTVFNTRWSAFLVKEGGEWKIASAHTGLNFMDNPYLRYKSMSWFQKLLVFLHLADSPVK